MHDLRHSFDFLATARETNNFARASVVLAIRDDQVRQSCILMPPNRLGDSRDSVKWRESGECSIRRVELKSALAIRMKQWGSILPGRFDEFRSISRERCTQNIQQLRTHPDYRVTEI